MIRIDGLSMYACILISYVIISKHKNDEGVQLYHERQIQKLDSKTSGNFSSLVQGNESRKFKPINGLK